MACEPIIVILGQYFGATIMLLAASTALTVIILNMYHRGAFGNDVPTWLRILVLDWLARFMCLKSRVDNNLSEKKHDHTKHKNKVSTVYNTLL